MQIRYRIYLWTFRIINIKPQKRIQHRRTGRAPSVRKLLRVYFWNVRLQNMHKLYCNQHAMFTICTLFSSLTIKAFGMSLQTSKIIPQWDRAPRFLNSWIRHWTISYMRFLYEVHKTKNYIYVHSGSIEIWSVALTQTSCTINYSVLWEVWNF